MAAINSNDDLEVLKVRYDSKSKVERHLFLKRFRLRHHPATSVGNKPENCTLFIANVPPFVTEHHIRHLLEVRCGKIVAVFFEEKASAASMNAVFNRIQSLGGKNTGEIDEKDINEWTKEIMSKYFDQSKRIFCYKVCYVVFTRSASLEKAMEMSSQGANTSFVLKPDDEQLAITDRQMREKFYTGVRLWQKQYNDKRYPPEEARKEIETFLLAYRSHQDEVEERQKTAAAAGPDAEGWLTVNRKLKRDRKALVSNQAIDEVIRQKYQDRADKRQTEESKFDAHIEKVLAETGMGKKKKAKTIEAMEF